MAKTKSELLEMAETADKMASRWEGVVERAEHDGDIVTATEGRQHADYMHTLAHILRDRASKAAN